MEFSTLRIFIDRETIKQEFFLSKLTQGRNRQEKIFVSHSGFTFLRSGRDAIVGVKISSRLA